MLEKLFKNDSCQRLLAGPMGPHLEALSSKLAELGYCDSQARKVVCTAAALGDWLAERGLTPAEAGRAELKAYIEAQKRMPSGRLRDGAVGFSRLPALLEGEGVLCTPSTETPADPCLRRFSAYLANVRGVTPSTQWTYRRFVAPLILGLCEADGPDWSKLTSDYVSNYVLGTTDKVRAAKGRVVSAVRTFLHFLVLEGVAPAQMVKAIPRVRRWRYAKLPKHLAADELALVLNACETQSKTSLRDRAFIALLARLGTRAAPLGSGSQPTAALVAPRGRPRSGMVSSLATLLSMLENIARRLSRLRVRVANLNGLTGNSEQRAKEMRMSKPVHRSETAGVCSRRSCRRTQDKAPVRDPRGSGRRRIAESRLDA